MKKFIYTLFVLVSFLGTAQNVIIPDVVFKQALLLSNATDQQVAFDSTGNPMVVDMNQDGEIQETEALAVYGLDLAGSQNGLFLVEGNPITDLTGLNSFLNLRNLDISTNQLTGQTVDVTIFSNLINFVAKDSSLSGVLVSNMTTLQKIDVSGNYLTEINLTGLTGLQELNVFSNQIQSLDFSDTTSLVKLDAGANPLTTLNWVQLTQLTDLNVSLCNQMNSVDVSAMINLRTLGVASTGITSLDVSNNVLLTTLDCSKDGFSVTSISNLDVSTLVNLKQLNCSGNLLLNELNVSGLVNLEYLGFLACNVNNPVFGNNNNLLTLDCSYNQITTLDLTLLPSLQGLSCIGNNLTSLDFSTLQNLNYVDCSNNQFQSLDFSNNPNFYYLDLGTNLQLEYLNIKNNANQLFFFSDVDLPNLIFVCADEAEIPWINNLGLAQNVVINSYCSFVPGGNYNTITGNVAFDLNQNGCETTDTVQPYVKVTINDGTQEGSVFTDSLGNYTFYVQEGNYSLSIEIENAALFTINGQNTEIEFLDANNNEANASFCVVPSGNQSDLEVVISPFSFPFIGGETYYEIYYRNKGNQTLSGNINFVYDTTKATLVLANPVQNGINPNGSLDFSFTDLLPFESRGIAVVLSLNGPTTQNPVEAGDVLQFTATGTITTTDINPADNQFVYNQTIEDFMIDNSIICIEGLEVDPTLIGDYLHYSINFENTSNQTSSFIVLRAIINPDEFDINSLQLLTSSSDVEVRITGNLLEIIFTNLQLESGGHGNVLLRIRTTDQLQPGDTVGFETEVYFNETTFASSNRAETTFRSATTLGGDDFSNTSISIYPNPTKSKVNIVDTKNTIQSIQLFDILGRMIQSIAVNNTSMILDFSQKPKGLYLLKVITDKGIKVQKIVRE